MSGEKRQYVSVEERELRRLRSLQQDLPERLNAIREEANRDLQNRLAPLEERAHQQEQEAQKLKSNLANLEQETHQRLQQQRQELQHAINKSESRQQEALQSEARRLQTAMREGFTQQRKLFLKITADQRQECLELNKNLDQKFTQLIAEERQAREQLQQQLEREKQDKTRLAQDLLDDVETIWQQIDSNYQHQRFAPGKLVELKRGLEMARSNIKAGVTEAAISTTQQTYLDLADLRLELEQKEQEWLLFYNAALEDLRSLIAEVRENRECEVEIGQGDEAQRFGLEVDYWTNGELNRYEQELLKIETRLQEGESSLTTEQLKKITEEISSLEPRFGKILEQAKLAILGSQLRAEIADKVSEVLGGMGYILVDPENDSVYEGGDMRNTYVLKLKDVTGGEVVTVISPEKEFGANQVSINSFGTILRDETAQKQNAKAILNALESEGIETKGSLECNDQPKLDYQNMEEVKQRQVMPPEQESQTSQV